MAKRKPKPATAKKPTNGPGIDTLQDEALDWVNILHYAVVTLDKSSQAYDDDIARARNATRRCHDNLHRLIYEMGDAARGDEP